ncbi:MAG TPA: hypothetical protein VFF52_11320 [Isosphaeraceae bacterium]|nr:hypothetical protein [Isosphaeraceae bacterium]
MNGLNRRFARLWVAGLVLVLAAVPPARAQLTQSEEERLQILTEPEALKKKLEKDRTRPPFEFFRSQVAPFDVLPYIKANHWTTLTLEMRANDDDYEGFLQTSGVMLLTKPGSDPYQEVLYRREARLKKEQRARLVQQVLLTRIPKEWMLDMVRPGALRPDASWSAALTVLEPHQMLVLVLSKEATNQFSAWNRMEAMIPTGAERDNSRDLDRLRYYRLVLPMEPDKLPLSNHPLTWSTISHVIWDGLPPDMLSLFQQQALLDWLHWGGQLIFTGGAGQAYPLYRESFLGPYLPAEATGETVSLQAADLQPLSQSYPPPTAPLTIVPDGQNGRASDFSQRFGRIYQPPAPIPLATGKPVYLSVLRPAPGSSTIPLGEASPHLLAVERRVGRGRITMLTLNPTEPALSSWPGLDTMIRRVVLRRPEEPVVGAAGFDGFSYSPPRRNRLPGLDLTWYRITSRDARPEEDAAPKKPEPPKSSAERFSRTTAAEEKFDEPEDVLAQLPGVSDWRDTMRFPTLARDLLDEASGITIPSSTFVIKVILAYLIAIVPLNWLVCRVLLNRREWAWLVVPLVALGFAIGVQRVAAYDLGFDSACDEIDLLEVQGEYPRAHLSRFASLYTSGRGSYAISYPHNPTALALPLDSGRSIRGEDVTTSLWQSNPVPALLGLSVQPRSLSFFRAEEMATLAGSIKIEGDGSNRRLVNDSELELRDATLVDLSGPNQRTEHALGTIAAKTSVAIAAERSAPAAGPFAFEPGPDPNPVLHALRTTWEPREENRGELRLVAWVARTMPGQVIEPPVDRHRGFTAVIVHLRSGPPPSPDGPRYNLLALGPEKLPAVDPRNPVELGTPTLFPRRGAGMVPRRPPAALKKARPAMPPRGPRP